MATSNSLAQDNLWLAALAYRDRLLSSASFRHWAAAFPLTRFIARRRARQTFDLVAGFVYSQILAACVRLQLFEILAESPRSIAALSSRLALSTDSTKRLIDAAVALRLVEPRGSENFGLGPLGAPIVGNAAIHAMVKHHELLYADLRDPVALLRGDATDLRLEKYWSYASSSDPAKLSDGQVSAYTELMAASQPLVTAEILDAIPFEKYRCLLDVGGGDGTFLRATGARYPHLELKLFDLPAVKEIAEQKMLQGGFAARFTATGGSFLEDPLPVGADIVSFVRVIHDHNDDSVAAMLRAAFAALPPGGALMIAEPMADTSNARSMGSAYFGFYLLAMGSGRPRTLQRLAELVRTAGFADPKQIPTHQPLQTSILLANKK